MQFDPIGSCSASCGVRNRRWTGLLAGEKQLGDFLGRGGIHQDVQEQKQPMWSLNRSQLPRCMSNKSVLLTLDSKTGSEH